MSTIDQAVKVLLATPRPVLILDTCSLLDIVRAPERGEDHIVVAAQELRDLSRQSHVAQYVPDIVPREFNDNLRAARRDGEKGIEAFRATWEIAARLNLPAPPLPVQAPPTLIDELKSLSEELLAASVQLLRDQDAMHWAIDRVVAKLKPSSGKGQFKDSHILGHALRLSTLLGTAFGKSRYFVSSNTSDFANPNGNDFHQDIAAAAAQAGLKYAISLTAVVAQLRVSGEIV